MRFLCLYILSFFFFIHTQAQNVQFSYIDITDGLPDNSIRDIIQDQKGYLWFATLNGLSRYDGNNFKNYYAKPGSPTSFNYSRLVSIQEDKRGNIWCRSYDGNVYMVDPATNVVLDIHNQLLNNNMSIRNFIITMDGDIWLWGRDGCVKINYSDESSNQLEAKIFNEENYIFADKTNFVFEDREKNIWIGTSSGLIKYYKEPGGNQVINTFFNDVNFISVYELNENIWFGSVKRGIRHFSKLSNRFSSYVSINESIVNHPVYTITHIAPERLLLGSDVAIFDVNIQKERTRKVSHTGMIDISAFFQDSKNNIWVSPTNRGIYKYDPNAYALKYYDLNASKRRFWGDEDKQIFFEDSNRNLWVGIHGGGLFKYINQSDSFENYTYSEQNTQSISSDIILSLFEDNSKNLWIGTMYGGINKINLKEEDIKLNIPKSDPNNIFENEIRSAIVDKNGNLWVGSRGGNIFCYDKNYNLKYSLPDDFSISQKKLMKDINVYCLFMDDENNLWVGTKGKGIYVLKNIIETKIQDVAIVQLNQSKIQTFDDVYTIKQDVYKQFWIGSLQSGLTVISQPFSPHPKVQVYQEGGTDHNIISNRIRFLFFDKENNLWIGTSRGMSFLPSEQLQESDKKFIPIINSKYDLSSLSYNSVDYIFQASDNKIYVATMGGGINRLEKYSITNKTFEWDYFNTSNGLSTNKTYAIQEDSDRNLWVSTSYGLNKFNMDTEKIEGFYIEKSQGLNYFTESCATKTNQGELLFGHRKGFVTFNPKQIRKDSTVHPIVLSRLFINGIEILPEESSLISKSIEYEKELELTYQQNSIRIDFSVLDFANPDKIQYSYILEGYTNKWSPPLTQNHAIFQNLSPGKYNFRLKATNSDGYELPHQLALKIHIKPYFLKSTWGYLIIILVVAIIFIVFLYLFKKQIVTKREIAYSAKLNDKKLEYYTNISHEFKTPLSLIMGPAQDIIDENDIKPTVSYNAKKILSNASYLLNLVEQILDFRKIREEKMKLAVSHINITDFISNVYSDFKPLAEKSDINLVLKNYNHNINGYVDKGVATKILYNLLSNAFKFTPAHKSITIQIDFNERSGLLKLSIIDQGKGITEENQNKLFERFSKSENSSGIGLFYVKELVSLHKGKIEVESEPNVGSTFTIVLPVNKSNYASADFAESTVVTNKELLTTSYLETRSEEHNAKNTEFDSSILVIEDNDEMREYLVNKFKPYYKVFAAINGKEGVSEAIEKQPDLIICDVMMPIMDGIEATKKLRKNIKTSHTPIILLTANSSEEKRIEGIEIGADDYITKPFNFKLLKLKIDNLVANRKKLIQRFIKEPELSSGILTKSDQDKKFIEKATRIIEENLSEPTFNVDMLSSNMGYSRTNFYKKMKGITGDTPNNFITVIQMKKAAALLKDTNYTIGDISTLVGFNDKGYFSKTFKKYFGTTPKIYQLENRE